MDSQTKASSTSGTMPAAQPSTSSSQRPLFKLTPTPTKHSLLDTDTSDMGMGAVLAQEVENREWVVAYSSSLYKPQQNCRELLAVVVANPPFQALPLQETPDHASLTRLLNFKELRLRWPGNRSATGLGPSPTPDAVCIQNVGAGVHTVCACPPAGWPGTADPSGLSVRPPLESK